MAKRTLHAIACCGPQERHDTRRPVETNWYIVLGARAWLVLGRKVHESWTDGMQRCKSVGIGGATSLYGGRPLAPSGVGGVKGLYGGRPLAPT